LFGYIMALIFNPKTKGWTTKGTIVL
jgi:hypothetical protein